MSDAEHDAETYVGRLERERDEARIEAAAAGEERDILRSRFCGTHLDEIHGDYITLARFGCPMCEVARGAEPETCDRCQAQVADGGYGVFCPACDGLLHAIEKERDEAQDAATNLYARLGEVERERDEARARLADAEIRLKLVIPAEDLAVEVVDMRAAKVRHGEELARAAAVLRDAERDAAAAREEARRTSEMLAKYHEILKALTTHAIAWRANGWLPTPGAVDDAEALLAGWPEVEP